MFEHLDDPIDFEPSTELRAQVGARARRIRRRRWTVAAGSGLATVLVAMVAIVGAVQWRVDQIDRVNIQTGTDVESGASDGVQYILLVGTDVSGRADTVAVARIDRESNRLDVLSIPRDYVPPGSTKRVSEIALDGPQALIDAVWPGADHYVQLDFDGFRSIIDAVGGVAVEVAAPLRDPSSGLDLEAGCSVLDGETALAFARSRHVEIQQPGGTWWTDPSSDLGRVERAKLLFASLAAAAHTADLNPVKVNELLTVLVDHATIDRDLGTGELVDLAWWFHGLDADATTFRTLPVEPGWVGATNVLLPTADTPRWLDTFRQGTVSTAIESIPPPPAAGPSAPASGRCS
jgi:LCP family protein required for cell wall assembly